MKSPIIVFAVDTNNWLHDPASPQVMIGVVAILAGLCMCGCGSMIWEYFFPFIVGAIGACFVLYEEETLPKLTPGVAGTAVLAVQTFFTLALAANKGFEGAQVLIGSILGIAVALFLPIKSHASWIPFAWACACSLLGVILFSERCRQSVLATMCPLLGALLLVSGSGTVAANLDMLPILPPDVVWVDTAVSLFGNAGATDLICLFGCALLTSTIYSCKEKMYAVLPLALGMSFGAVTTATGLGAWLTAVKPYVWPLWGGLVWMFIALCGTCLQLSMLPKSEAAEGKASKKAKTKAAEGKAKAKAEANAGNAPLSPTYPAEATTHSGPPETQGLLTQPQLHAPAMGGYHGEDVHLPPTQHGLH